MSGFPKKERTKRIVAIFHPTANAEEFAAAVKRVDRAVHSLRHPTLETGSTAEREKKVKKTV
jgi:hypothetical protein